MFGGRALDRFKSAQTYALPWQQSCWTLLNVISLEQVTSRAREIVATKLASGMDADEFIEIGNADGFKIYVAAGKTLRDSSYLMHDNPRDVFMLVLEGEIEFMFEDGERQAVKPGECFVLPKHLKHQCIFRRLTIAVEGVFEEGL